MNILIIDNYDSFTYNLYQMIGEIAQSQQSQSNLEHYNIQVVRNDEMSLSQIKQQQPDRIILSPGPGNPEDDAYFGIGKQVINELGSQIPILGVCLGMQGIVSAFGGRIKASKLPMHGKISAITHNGQSIFSDLPHQLDMMRYHSLQADISTLPECLEVTAIVGELSQDEFKTQVDKACDVEIMAIRHKNQPIHGVQFHPESFASEAGRDLIRSFLFHN